MRLSRAQAELRVLELLERNAPGSSSRLNELAPDGASAAAVTLAQLVHATMAGENALATSLSRVLAVALLELEELETNPKRRKKADG